MASCEVKPELWVNRFHRIKDQLATDNPSGIAQDIDQQARVIFMGTIYGPDVKSITQEWKREKIIPGPTYKVTPEGLTCLYAGKEISLRELAVDNVKEQTPQNYNSTEEKILLSAEKAILQSPTAEVVFPIYNQDGRIRYLSQWKRKDNLVETAMIDISQDGQDKTLEEAKTLVEQMAKEKKGRIKTDKENQEIFILDSQPYSEPRSNMLPFLERISLIPAKSDEQVELPVNLAEAVEISFPTVLHRTVGNNIPVNPVLPELASLFFTLEQDSKKTVVAITAAVAEPLFMPFQSIQPIQVTPIMPAVEQTSMIPSQRELAISKIASIIEENSAIVKPIVKKEWAQPSVSLKIAPAASVFQPQALMVNEMAKESLIAVETQTAPVFFVSDLTNYQPAVGWQTRYAAAYPDCHRQRAKVVAEKPIIGVVQAEQQPLFEKAIEEFSLPLLEIATKSAPVVTIRAALKPAVDEVYNFETELMDKQLSATVKKKAVHEIDQKQDRLFSQENFSEQGKLFLVENFALGDHQPIKDQRAEQIQIKKLVWRIKTRESESTEASILEFEPPKDQNQRLYAFYHFLQKVVKKVVGEDVIRQRKVKVIAEEEDVDLNLELVQEIEYYLQLLRGKKHAQAFALVN